MAWTAAQSTAFWTNAEQMGLPADVVESIANDGITDVDSLVNYYETNLRPIQKRVNRDNTIGHFGELSFMRILTACHAVRYYNTVGRTITPGMMRWNHTLKNFHEGLKALRALTEKAAPEIPRISRAVPVMKWAPAFEIVMESTYGTRDFLPLMYVIRKEVHPADPPPSIVINRPYSEEFGSLRAELIARASHDHVNFDEDNGLVFDAIELSTRGTKLAASIQPFRRQRNGRGAYNAIIGHYLGEDKWVKEFKKSEGIIHGSKWKSTGNQSLETFIAMHRNSYQQMLSASQHVPQQLPNEFSCVGFLLDNIQTTDANLSAAIASIKQNRDVDGPRYNFEEASAILQAADPVASRQSTKRTSAQISSVEADDDDVNVSSTALKKGVGKTGVQLQYYKDSEFRALSKAQKTELISWRNTPEGKTAVAKEKAAREAKKQNRGGKEKTKANISALVEQEVAKALKSSSTDSDSSQEKLFMAAVKAKMQDDPNFAASVGAMVPSKTTANASGASVTEVSPDYLAKIIGRARNKS